MRVQCSYAFLNAICLITFLTVFSSDSLAQSFASVSVGYGTQKIAVRGDFNVSESLINVDNSSTRVYIELGGDWQKFEQETFLFNRIPYKSNVWMLGIGAGIGQEFIFKDVFVLYPYFGIYYKYARFTDQALVEAIGTQGIQRYVNNYTRAVGKVVNNGYGNLFTVDLGTRIGFRIKDKFEIGGTVGLCPQRFSTPNTLFGRYWAEKPYENELYIKRSLLKAEASLKFHF